MHPFSCTNTYHDFTDLVNHGMFKKKKNSPTGLSTPCENPLDHKTVSFHFMLRCNPGKNLP